MNIQSDSKRAQSGISTVSMTAGKTRNASPRWPLATATYILLARTPVEAGLRMVGTDFCADAATYERLRVKGVWEETLDGIRHLLRAGAKQSADFRVVISAVDSISSRRNIFSWVKQNWPEYFIDVRMNAEDGAVFVVGEKDYIWYENYLNQFSDSDIADLPCTSKATFHTGLGIASEVGAIYAAMARGDRFPAYLSVNYRHFDKSVLRWSL